MLLTNHSFNNGDPIPSEFAFCMQAAKGHVDLATNKSPHLSWSELPDGTKSLAIILVDPDVPSVGDDVNQEGKSVPASLPRTDFYHWVLVDIPPTFQELPEGAVCDGITPRGKTPGKTNYGVRGINDYTSWFKGDPEMDGTYAGYDGPCPPWNDELIHRYFFTLYALDVETLNLSGNFTGSDALAAMKGHVLDQAQWMGTYTVNPNATTVNS
jgi:hypothetical protein